VYNETSSGSKRATFTGVESPSGGDNVLTRRHRSKGQASSEHKFVGLARGNAKLSAKMLAKMEKDTAARWTRLAKTHKVRLCKAIVRLLCAPW
jgi:hypothetical protein